MLAITGECAAEANLSDGVCDCYGGHHTIDASIENVINRDAHAWNTVCVAIHSAIHERGNAVYANLKCVLILAKVSVADASAHRRTAIGIFEPERGFAFAIEKRSDTTVIAQCFAITRPRRCLGNIC